jgi:hypothetical protein
VAVLIEAYSILVRREAIELRFLGGVEAFEAFVPNRTLLTDGSLFRVGFLAHHDAMVFATGLVRRGLVGPSGDEWRDFALTDHRIGVLGRAPWLGVGHMPVDGGEVMAGWLAEVEPGAVVVPTGWRFAGSLTDSGSFVTEEEVGERYRYERGEGGNDVLVDTVTNERGYVGRIVPAGDDVPQIRAYCQLAHIAANATERAIMGVQPGPGRRQEVQALRDDFGPRFLPRLEELASGSGAHLPEVHYVHGAVLRVMGRREEAVSAFERAHRLSAPWKDLSIATVQCMLELGWFEGAIRFAEPSVEHFPESGACWGNLAAAYVGVGRLEDAQRAIEQALALEPTNAINLRIQGEIEEQVRRRRPWWRRFGPS